MNTYQAVCLPLRRGMLFAYLLSILAVSLLGCASLQPAASYLDRLCHGQEVCVQMVENADQQTFSSPEEAVHFSLAYLHYTYPNLHVAAAIYVTRDGTYYFEEAGAGTGGQLHLNMSPQVLMWVHTHPFRDANCNRRDQELAGEISMRAGRRVRSFIQHRYGPVQECAPR